MPDRADDRMIIVLSLLKFHASEFGQLRPIAYNHNVPISGLVMSQSVSIGLPLTADVESVEANIIADNNERNPENLIDLSMSGQSIHKRNGK